MKPDSSPNLVAEAFFAMEELLATTPKRATKAQFRRCREAIMWYYAVIGGTMWEIDNRKGVPVDVGTSHADWLLG